MSLPAVISQAGTSLGNVLGVIASLILCGGPVLFLVAIVLRYRQITAEQQRERNAERGICPHCGYDNRSSGPRCSECGKRNPVHWRQELKALERASESTPAEDGDQNG